MEEGDSSIAAEGGDTGRKREREPGPEGRNFAKGAESFLDWSHVMYEHVRYDPREYDHVVYEHGIGSILFILSVLSVLFRKFVNFPNCV